MHFLKTDLITLPNIDSVRLADLKFPPLLDGSEFEVASLKNKVVIISNTASKCGYTDGHYRDFVALMDEFKDRGFVVLGFPCAQFSNQEYSEACDIKSRADRAKINFPIFQPLTDVNGPNTSPIFQWCKYHSKAFGKGPLQAIGWNFGKFLIGRDGNVIGYFGPMTKPSRMRKQIEEALSKA